MDLSLIIINGLKKSDIHDDKKSIEEASGKQKRKFKIFTSRYLDSFIFFVFTRNKDTCNKQFRIRVVQDDYVDKKQGCLEENYSYIDASKPDILGRDKIVEKINDPQNGFKYIGRLKADRFQSLIGRLHKSRKCRYFSEYRTKTIDVALKSLANEKLENLGLS